MSRRRERAGKAFVKPWLMPTGMSKKLERWIGNGLEWEKREATLRWSSGPLPECTISP